MNLDRKRGALVAGIAVISIGVICCSTSSGVFQWMSLSRFTARGLVVVGLNQSPHRQRSRRARLWRNTDSWRHHPPTELHGITISPGVRRGRFSSSSLVSMLIIHSLSDKPSPENIEFISDPHLNSFFTFSEEVNVR